MSIIWITGAHGFIGRYLARQMESSGHHVLGIGHGSWSQPEASHWGISNWFESDVDMENLDLMLQASGIPDEIYHLAGGSSVGVAFSDPYDDFKRTVGSTGELIEWQRQHAPNARLVAVSSAAVYGSGNTGPIDENASLSPFSPYGAHKLMMETLCRSYAVNFGLKVVLPRLFSVYGPEIQKQLLWDLCGKLSADGPVELGGSGQELRDWTNVCNVAKGLSQAASLADDTAQTLNIATGVATSIYDIATTVAEHWGGPAAVKRVNFSGKSRVGDPFSLVANVGKAYSYDIKCNTPVAYGLGEYVDWYRNTVMAAR